MGHRESHDIPSTREQRLTQIQKDRQVPKDLQILYRPSTQRRQIAGLPNQPSLSELGKLALRRSRIRHHWFHDSSALHVFVFTLLISSDKSEHED